MILEKWRRLISLGVTAEMNYSKAQEIRVLNSICLYAIFYEILVSFNWLFLLDAFSYSIFYYSAALIFSFVIFLNKTGHYYIARLIFLAAALLQLAMIDIFFDYDLKVFLIPLLIVAGFLFPEKKYLLIFMLIELVFVIVMSYDFFGNTIIKVNRENDTYVILANNILAITFTLLALNQFLNLFESNRREILVKNKLLEGAASVAKERADYSTLLMKEMNHRIKNNLQMISSLLNIHEEKTNSKVAKAALNDAKARIFSIALIHKQLYIHNNISRIDLAKYLEDLIPFIKMSAPLPADSIKIITSCPPIPIVVDEAVSVGLIINELVTNSIKHNISINRQLQINLDIKYDEDHFMTLILENNGKPFSKKEFFSSKHFGLQLVRVLTSTQNGDIEVVEKSNQVVVKLKLDKYVIQFNKKKENHDKDTDR